MCFLVPLALGWRLSLVLAIISRGEGDHEINPHRPWHPKASPTETSCNLRARGTGPHQNQKVKMTSTFLLASYTPASPSFNVVLSQPRTSHTSLARNFNIADGGIRWISENSLDACAGKGGALGTFQGKSSSMSESEVYFQGVVSL